MQGHLRPFDPLDRLVARQRHTITMAYLGIVIPRSMVLGTAVVPHCNGVWRPMKPALKVDMFHVPVKEIERRPALVCFHAANSGGECGIDVQRLALRLRMGSYDRVLGFNKRMVR